MITPEIRAMMIEERARQMKERARQMEERGLKFSSRSTIEPLAPASGSTPTTTKKRRKRKASGGNILSKTTSQRDSPAIIKLVGEPEDDSTANPGIPLRAEEMLSWICSPDEMEEVLGDFEERFIWVRERRGVPSAQRWYWAQTVKYAIKTGRNLIKKGTIDKIKKRKVRK